MSRLPLGRAALCCAMLAAGFTTGRADVFYLKGPPQGGQVRGVLVNPKQSPRTTYVIQTASGGQVTLAAQQVERVQYQKPAEIKYDRFRADIPDTVQGQWIAAEWCRTNRLSKLRQRHLQRIIELDPDHAGARRALGYSQVGGRWATQEEAMVESGYVRSKFAPGKWVLPQEEKLLKRRDEVNKAQLAWKAQLKRWNNWLSGDKAPQAIAGIEAITDPFAVPALADQLAAANPRDVRLLYVAALGRINRPAALDVLSDTSLYDQDKDIRTAALEEVARRDYEPAVYKYVAALRHENNVIVNRAGLALKHVKEPIAIGPLIEALVTTHRIKMRSRPTVSAGSGFAATFGRSGNQTFGSSSSFSNFSVSDGKPKIIEQTFENRYVLDALVELSDGVSFNFDVDAWKRWDVARRKPSTLDSRRDARP